MQYSVLYELTQILEYKIYVYIFSIGVSESVVFLILPMFYLQLAGNNEPMRVTTSTFNG